LPLEVRPLVCRIYPYDYDQHGLKAHELAQGCPLELLRPGQGLLEALDMNREDAQRWYGMLYEEILQNHARSAEVDEPEGEAAEPAAAGGVPCASA
jgi:Fe-S-cluster containining protein